jgi:glycosyltransferase involved in cell wall biosynthesis
MVAENRPPVSIGTPKIGYELSALLNALSLFYTAWKLKPKTILLTWDTGQFLYFSILKITGAKIVVAQHAGVWPEGFKPTGLKAKWRLFGARLFWKGCETISVSPAVARQAEVVGAKSPFIFRPSFPEETFAEEPMPRDFKASPFRVMFAGRIERNKGVFDILTIAENIRRNSLQRAIEFVICGDGSELDALNAEIRAHGLGELIKTRGRLKRPELVKEYLNAHMVIVPTKSDFAEGFAMVVAEAVLLLRPVISSSVVPSTEILKNAVMLAKTDDTDSYVKLLAAVSSSEETYSDLVFNCRRLRPMLLDNSSSFLVALRHAYGVSAKSMLASAMG